MHNQKIHQGVDPEKDEPLDLKTVFKHRVESGGDLFAVPQKARDQAWIEMIQPHNEKIRATFQTAKDEGFTDMDDCVYCQGKGLYSTTENPLGEFLEYEIGGDTQGYFGASRAFLRTKPISSGSARS